MTTQTLIKGKWRKNACGYRVDWKEERGATRTDVYAVVYNRAGRSLNLVRGYTTLPVGKKRRGAERRLLAATCVKRRKK